MRVLLVTLGSRGDVHPMLGLGQALRARGHAVSLVSNPAFGSAAHDAGLDFLPVGTEEAYRQTLAHPKLWHPIDGLGVMWRYLLRPALRPCYDVLQTHALPAAGSTHGALVVASPLAMGARVAQEKLGIRLVSSYTSATLLRSVHDPLTLAQWRVPAWMPHGMRRGLWTVLDRAKLDPLVKPALESLRGGLGLPPLAGPRSAVFDRWMHSPLGGLALFPDWFAARAPDWPVPVTRGAFPLYDDGASATLPPDLQRFLDAGPPPVVFMPGSAQQGTNHFFRTAVEACQQLSLRAILLGPAGALAREALPATVWQAPYCPFAALLPRARAIVHHGGIGTCAQALRAGIPQLAWPQAYDQFDNAMRLERLGVGRELKSRPLALSELVARLDELVHAPAVRQACARQAANLANDSGVEAACAWLETLA